MADVATDRAVSATDGSARSQAADLDERQWKPRRGLARVVRFTAFTFPIVASFVAARTFAEFVSQPAGVTRTVIWVVALLGISLTALRLTEILARKLLPLSAMLTMSLVFPDRAPSRFSSALRSSSSRHLVEAVRSNDAEARLGTPQQMAERLVVLLAALKEHDPLTRGHSERVRAYADIIGQQLELSPDDKAKLHWAALIHDLGKLDVSPVVLNKKDRLDATEWEEIRSHPKAAEKWIDGLDEWLGPWALAATQHHERWDGTGYPYGLAGEEITLAGRIVSVADAFDVMTATRSYKPALPMAQARAELAKGAGTQFDPLVVRAMLDASIPEMRWRAGPLAALLNIPTVLQAPLAATVGAAGTNAAAVGAAALLSVAAVAPTAQPLELSTPRTAEVATESVEADVAEAIPVDADLSQTSSENTRFAVALEAPAISPSPPPDGPAANETDSQPAEPPRGTPTPTTAAPAPPTTTPPTPPAPTTTEPASSGHGPFAREDRYDVALGTSSLTMDVLANDQDTDGDIDSSTLRILVPSLAGNSARISGGTVVYTLGYVPPPAFRLDDAFAYSVCDATELCTVSTVHVTFEQPDLFG